MILKFSDADDLILRRKQVLFKATKYTDFVIEVSDLYSVDETAEYEKATTLMLRFN